MKTKKRAGTASRFTRGVKLGAKKTRRHTRPRVGMKRSEEAAARTLDRLTPL